jgi:oxygen-independent coproporphyrinogen III oxidase
MRKTGDNLKLIDFITCSFSWLHHQNETISNHLTPLSQVLREEPEKISVDEAGWGNGPLGLYVHVPFCQTTCDFCAFVQSKPDRARMDAYLEGVSNEWSRYLQGGIPSVSTVFWGGGTPGVLPAKDLERLGGIIKNGHALDSTSEWSVELAPATVSPARLEVLRAIGVTRVSMGVQTFNASALEIMGRQHSVGQIRRAYEWIREAGFSSVNLDLIIAYPGQSETALMEDLQEATALAPDHLSTYCLTFEEDTALWAKLQAGIYKINPEFEANLYERTWAFLEDRGFKQYEISNFAKDGHQCIHNLNTWRMTQWIGLGPSASSQWAGRRYTNPHGTDPWLAGVRSGQIAWVDETLLTPDLLLADSLIFGLRMNEGVDLSMLATRFAPATLACWEPLFSRLIKERLAVLSGNCLSLTLEGRLKADAVGAAILEAQMPS